MKKYIINRLLQLIPILIGVSFISFFLMQLSSSDFVDIMYDNQGGVLTREAAEAKREELGLDKPFLEQYFSWATNLLKGDMGTSFSTGEDALKVLLSKLPNTALLTLSSVLLTFMISLPLGVISALKQNKFTDAIIRGTSFLAGSLPSFIIAFLLIYIFSVNLKWLPIISGRNLFIGMIMPTLALSVAMSSKYIRQIRTIVLDELKKDYIAGLKSRGIPSRDIIRKSVLKSAMITITTLLSLSIGSLLGGTAIIESIFLLDGMGKMAIDAVLIKDYPVVQAYVIIMTIIYLLVNLITDIIYHAIDPRVRKNIG